MPPRKNVKAPTSPSDRYTRSRTAALRSPLLQPSTSAPQPSTSGAQARQARQPHSPKFYRTPYRDFESDPESSPENNFQQQVRFENTSTPARQISSSEPDLTGSQLFTSASSDFNGFSDQVTINADSDNTINPDLIETSESDTDMSDNEDLQRNVPGGNLPQQIPPPQVPAAPLIPADFMQFMQWQARQQEEAEARREAREERQRQDAERVRREDLARIGAERVAAEERQERLSREMREQSETQIAALAEQIRILNLNKSTHPKPPAQKLEQFDLEKDGHTFKQWRSRWNTHVEFYGMDTIEDEEERDKAQYQLLKPALSTQTLAWLDNRNLPEDNTEQPEFILDHIDTYLKESVNVTMKVVDLMTMQRHPHEKIDALLARINENASFVDYEAIKKDPRDFLSLVALQVAVDAPLRIRIWQEKAKTYTEAAMICKQDELAHLNAKMNKKDGTIAATSHYKQTQNQERQAQQPNQGGFKAQQNHSRGGYSGNHGGRGGSNLYTRPPYFNTTGQTMPYNGPQAQAYNANPNLFQTQPPLVSQERGRSRTQEHDRSQSRSRSKRSYPGLSPDQCYSCGNAADHPRHTCPAFLKVCDNCGKTGHIKKVCQQPQGQAQATGHQQSQQTTQQSGGSITAVFANQEAPKMPTPLNTSSMSTFNNGFIGTICAFTSSRKVITPERSFIDNITGDIKHKNECEEVQLHTASLGPQKSLLSNALTSLSLKYKRLDTSDFLGTNFKGEINSLRGLTAEEQRALDKAREQDSGYRKIPPLPADFATRYTPKEQTRILWQQAEQRRINIEIEKSTSTTPKVTTSFVSSNEDNNQSEVCTPNISSVDKSIQFAEIEPLDTIMMGFRDTKTGHSFEMDVLPDTGASVTAISRNDSTPLEVETTRTELRSADDTQFKVWGRAQCILSIKGRETPEYVYVIDGLSKPLISRRALKALGLLHPDWPHQQPGIYAVGAPNTSQIQPEDRANKTPFVTTTKIDNTVNQDTTLSINTNEETNTSKKIETGCGPELDMLVNEYPDLFDGRCTPMYSGEYKIELEPDAKPVSSGACRNIQLPYVPALKKELETLVDQDIIEKITHATPWLHPIVVVPKKGTADIRLCVDFSKINKFVKRPVNPQPTPWEIVRNLPTGTRHFAVFDALKGYHQIPLAEESRDLTAFMTPFGRYRYKRLAFGINSANDVFTLRYGNAIDKATDGLRATEDTLLRGSTSQELIDNTRKFFDACRQNGITLNQKKIQWDKREVLFAGFLLDPTGYRLDPSLNKALSEFPTPTNQTDVRSFMGLANQLSNSSQDIATALIPLSPLLKKGRMFQWLPEHQMAFEKARTILSSEKTLAYYSPMRQTRLVTDASRLNGLGFVLKQLQEDDTWKPVQAGSRFLSSAETRYAMIELEMLAIAWACAKTANFIEGLPIQLFEIWTDHNPLIAILSNQTLPDISNKRLQRLKMKIDHLTFTIKWIQGKDNVEADVLSRHPCSQPSKEDQLDEGADAIICAMSLDIEIQQIPRPDWSKTQPLNPEAKTFSPRYEDTNRIGVINIMNTINTITFEMAGTLSVMKLAESDVTDQRRNELKSFAIKDTTYNEVIDLISRGFPNLKTADIPTHLQPYFKVQETLHIDPEGFLMNKGKLVVPQALVQTYLKRLLGMHQAGPKMVGRARQTLWWPHMAKEINSIAKTCLPCEESKPSNPAEIILSHEPALYPFQFCHMDLAQEEGRYYLITVDQFSAYPNIHELGKTCKAKQVIDATAHFISLFSIPEVIYSDGGPQFLEHGEFDTWCKEWGIKLVRSSPYMPRSNGVAEAAVKEMKKLIRANLKSSGTIDTQSTLAGLIMFRNTPRSPTNKSPAELLFGRQIRDSLPCPRDNLLPQYRYYSEEKLDRHETNKQAGPTKELPLLSPKTLVRIQNPQTKKWDTTGEVLDFGLNRREYMVITGDKIIRRNRHFLKEYTTEATPAWKQPVQVPSNIDSDENSPPRQKDNSSETAPTVKTSQPTYEPAGVTTRQSSPNTRALIKSSKSDQENQGSISLTTPENSNSTNQQTSVKFGNEKLKLYDESDPVKIPTCTAHPRPPIIKVRDYTTPLTGSNAIPIDLSLRHSKNRQLPQELSLLQLALMAKAHPEINQDYYKTFVSNSLPISSQQPDATLLTNNNGIYRHPNASTKPPLNNFQSVADRHQRLRPSTCTSTFTATTSDSWLATPSMSRPWNKSTTSN